MTAITATMNQWEASQDSPEVVVNENFKTLQWSAVYACNPDTTAGLTWGYYGGEYGDFTVTAGTLTLTTATTNYIVVLRSTGVISTSTSITNWNNTALYARVYLVTTGASTVSTVADHRTRTNGIFYYSGSFTGGTLTSALNEAPIVTIASSTTPAIFAAAGNTISMTGTTTVTGFDTIAAGAVRRVVFTGILQLTHNATSMINITGANITTAAGDIATFLSLGSGNTRMVAYERASGAALTGGSGATELKGLTFTSDTASQADSDPGSGLFRWNNATQSSATQLFIDNSTADAVSVSTFWASLGSAGFIYMQQGDDSTKWQLWKWTATPTNGTGYYKFTVTLQASGGSIANTKTVYMTFEGAASGGSFTGGTLTSALNEAPAVTLASAGTVNIGAAAANTINITGTTTITAFDTIADGALRRLVFGGALVLTHNATSLILPTGSNITTAAGDSAVLLSLGSGNWRCVSYHRADGTSLAGASRSPAIQAVTSASTVTPTFSDDLVKITAQAAALTLANPTGTAIPGLGMVIRIKDNGTARTIGYGTQYRAIGITLPTTTVISKTTYLAMIYNSDDTKWDVVATGTEI